MDDLLALMAFSQLSGFGYKTYLRLTQVLGRFDKIFKLSSAEQINLGLTQKQQSSLKKINWQLIEKQRNIIEQDQSILALPITDSRYPAQLLEISSPPLMLYLKGDNNLLAKPQLAIVGSRQASDVGRRLTYEFAKDLGKKGFVITSGGALGIDAEAHRGALQSHKTVAVLGCGFNHIYPKAHEKLFKNIVEQGVLVSEYLPDAPPKGDNFPKRNRIISGLSLGVIVVEAALRSGSLITAYMALEQNREVFAVPGNIHHPLARGCHSLIRQGATLVETVADILAELPPIQEQELLAEEQSGFEPRVQKIFDLIGYKMNTIDEVIAQSGLSAAHVTPILTELAISGHIKTVPGGYARVIRINHERKRA